MGRAIAWLVEMGSGLYALTGSFVVLGGFVIFLIEMAGHLSTERSEHRKVNVYVNEVHIHVHSTAAEKPLRSLSQDPELPAADEEKAGPSEDPS